MSQADPFAGLICVEPPYYALRDVRIEGELVHATALPELLPEDDGKIAVSEVGRHLAALGSCAIVRAAGLTERSYFPIREAVLEATPLVATAAPALVRVSSSCSFHEPGRAGAHGELRTDAGELLWTSDIDFHVLTKAGFARLFARHKQPTPILGAAVARSLDMSFDGAATVGTLGPVTPELCAGHFRDYPALPVATMGRYAMQVGRAAVLRALGVTEVRAHVRTTRVTARRFLFPPEAVTFRARATDERRGLWTCDVLGTAGLAASFAYEIEFEQPDELRGRKTPMNEQELFDKVVSIIKPFARDAAALGTVSKETRILEDLKVNSARLVDIVIAFEDEFKIAIDDSVAEKVSTIGDAVKMIGEKLPDA